MAKIKICGLFRNEDIDYVNLARPDYVGFVFAASRRRVTPDGAARLWGKLAEGIVPVGVFVDAPPEEIAALCARGVIEIAQLHGHEDETYIARLKELCPAPIIKAVSVKSARDIEGCPAASADYLLLDHGSGGSGERFDWKVIQSVAKPFFLAGGVRLENLAEALSHDPYCIDVSSGAETKGVKDREKIETLVRRVREAAGV
jgi:phosphoribosylanthranilate isomerase